jgi:hypothetical protein
MLVVLAAASGQVLPAGPPLARLSIIEPEAELREKGRSWRQAVEGSEVAVGDAVRVGPGAVARLDLPWMALTIGANASVRFADEMLLSASLDGGRVLIEAEARDALPLSTPEAEVRGRGRAVVRRRAHVTLVTCLSGVFHVSGAGKVVSLGPGQGCVVRHRSAPGPAEAAPAPPGRLFPGRDPVYVAAGEPIELRWRGRAAAYQVELLPVGAEVVLLQRDVSEAPLRVEVPWPGAFRWRVSARDDRGLEGPPSEEGLIAVE